MAFLDSMKEFITSKPPNLTGPHLYKTDSDAQSQLEKLNEYYKNAPGTVKKWVEQDIRMLEYGISGEKNVAFELKNAYLPMIVLHDLHIQHNGLSSQIDYLVITQKVNLVIECKNLVGNIEVTKNGEFIRTTQFNGRYKKEGIYSPITQNERHLAMIREIRLSQRNNFITKSLFEKYFDDNYKSVVVLANPKTIINMAQAPKDISAQIIRCDQLVGYIKKLNNESKSEPSMEKQMYELADFFLSLHKPNEVDYTKRYLRSEDTAPEVQTPLANDDLENTPLYQELKKYRYDTSKMENVKAYFIFTNRELEDIIARMPQTLDELKKVAGFGEVKCQKYGNAILQIVKKYI